MSIENAPERVHRHDSASFGRAVRLDNGMMRAPARLARVGVLTYRRDDGSSWNELRTEKEVFDPESLKSFDLLPLTHEHPREGTGAVTSQNAKRLSVGAVGHVHRDSEDRNWIAADLMVTDVDMINAIENGKVQISAGYFADRVKAPAGATVVDPITGDSMPYDFIQTNIRGNHVAVVSSARAGPGARILLDATDAIEVENQTGASPVRKAEMNKITIDGVSYEVTPQVSEALSKERKQFAEIQEALKAEGTKNLARADALDSECKQLKLRLDAATDPKAVSALVAERVAVESVATKHEIKCDGLSNDQIKRAVISKIDASIKLDSKSVDYVSAMFDALAARAPAGNPLSERGAAAVVADSTATKPAAPVSTDDHRAKFNASFFASSAQKRSNA